MWTEKRCRFELANRTSIGVGGQPILLISNHFQVNYDTSKLIYSFYVSINQVNHGGDEGIPVVGSVPVRHPGGSLNFQGHTNSNAHKAKTEAINRKVLKKIFEEKSGPGDIFHNVYYVYDGASTLYTCEPLATISDKLTKLSISFNEHEGAQPQIYEISLKAVGRHFLQELQNFYQSFENDGPSEVIRSINLVVRHLFLMMRFLVGRSSFHTPSSDDTRASISPLKEISYGVFSSVQACSAGLHLILDRSCAPFLKSYSLDECIRQMMQECGAQRWNEFVRRKLETIVKDYYFEAKHLRNSRKYKISGLTLESANKITFLNSAENNRVTSVAEYFSKTYSKLNWPELPCVKVRRGKNDFIYFPVEVCHLLPDQKANKLTIKEKADMIRNAAAVMPSERFEIIGNNADELIEMGKQTGYFRDFGLNVSEKPISVRGRILEPPTLLTGSGSLVPVAGRWRLTKFFKPARINNWILIKIARIDDSTLNRFSEMIIRTGESLGMTIPAPQRIQYNFESHTIHSFFHNLVCSFGKPDLMYFVGCDNEQQYNTIKKMGDVDFGIATQCTRQVNVVRMSASIASNVLQKVNVKLNGVNASVARKHLPVFLANNFEKVMVIGMDVTHPPVTDRDCPSIAALVANCSADMTRYTASVRVQKYFRLEIIQDLDKMIIELLKIYEEKMKTLPDRVVIYRDGVSEGQFQTMFNEEVRVIKETLVGYHGDYRPKLTFIVVQKRHHTRFMPDNSKEGIGKGCNIPPGTVVDNIVVHPKNFDFYLCSHAGIQGTSRSSHYCGKYLGSSQIY